jgi:hypothetical protein
MRAPPVTSARRAMSTAQRQHQIVESAAMLFDAQGYGNTSMEDVALSVSIAKRTLYGSQVGSHHRPAPGYIGQAEAFDY